MDKTVSRPSFLRSNLAILAERQPDLARRLSGMKPSSEILIQPSSTGRPTLVKNKVSLHSRYDPEAEAQAWSDSSEVKAVLASGLRPLVFGFGLGYHLRILADLTPHLMVYEPDIHVLLAALDVFDWRLILPRLTILTSTDSWPDRLAEKAALLIHRPTERLEPMAGARLRSIMSDAGPSEQSKSNNWKILVVPPFNGGSLPVAHHSAQALTELGHAVTLAKIGLEEDQDFSANPANIALSGSQADFGRLMAQTSRRLLDLVATERPRLVLALAQAPLDTRTLAGIKARGCLTAFWFVEDFRLWRYYRETAPAYDYFFHIQGRDLEEELARLKVRHSLYLPLAADEYMFRPLDDQAGLEPYRADLAFVGAGYPNRRAVFSHLLEFDLKIWGTQWDLANALGRRVQDGGRRVSPNETALIFNAAKVNLNLHSSPLLTGLDPGGGYINPRTFEIASCGSFQLVDRRNPLERHFALETELATYADLKELKDKVDYFLLRPELRREIGRSARARVLAEHTYKHRLKTMLEYIETTAA
ncbi:MAG: glycosyltransferase [Thermodesulfobacteriota bacterium]